MKTYQEKGIYGTGTVYLLEKVEDFDELATIKGCSLEELDKHSNFSSFKEDFIKYIGKLWVDTSDSDIKLFRIIGLEDNEPMADWYWVVEYVNDKSIVKHPLANDPDFYRNILEETHNDIIEENKKNKEIFESDIINRDFEGWPVYKHSLRSILLDLGFNEIEHDGKKYLSIEVTDKLLDAYPITLEDDGMGYGINKKYITEASKEIYKDEETKDEVFNLFIEAYSKENVDKLCQ